MILVGDCFEHLRGMGDCSVDAVVTDPPYELGFMGKAWDSSGVAYRVDLWGEVLRVLKPGGHLLAFGGSRTYHRLACAVEDAGFEIRDQIMWVYGSGFPKSLDVSKAIDKQRDDREDIYRVTAWVRAARDAAGITNKEIDAAFGFAGMAGHWTSSKSQPAVPTLDQVPTLLHVLGVTADEVPAEIRRLLWDLNGKKGQPGDNWAKREVVGTAIGGIVPDKTKEPPRTVGGHSMEYNITVPATDAAKQWQGWGTALKPAHEPIVVARKPLEGTVAANVLEHGTGALNIDACRVGIGESVPGGGGYLGGAATRHDGWKRPAHGHNTGVAPHTLGRWPANLIHDGSDEVLEHFPDDGTAARFFYCAKAGKAERNAGLDATANTHPTVKPVALMRYLVRLVTPPDGVVFDPFLGSGTTAVAAILEGKRWVGCELTEEYVPIIEGRVAWAEANRGML